MTPLQNLHYAIGEIAYAIAFADGKIQKEEASEFTNIVTSELANKDYSFDLAQIIFELMRREKTTVSVSYDRAIKDIRLNSHYLSPELKAKFIAVIEKIAAAYPPVTTEESNLLDQFMRDIAPLHGDPVYYNSKP